MSISTAISALAAGGQLLGGLSGFFGGTNVHKRLSQMQGYQNLELQRRAFEEPLTTMVRDAKRAGLHPTAVLGGAPTGQFIPSQFESGSGRGNKVAQMGRALQHAALAAGTLRDEAEAQLLASKTKTEEQKQEVLVTALGDDWKVGPHTPGEKWEEVYGGMGEIEGAKKYIRDWATNKQNRKHAEVRRQAKLYCKPGQRYFRAKPNKFVADFAAGRYPCDY